MVGRTTLVVGSSEVGHSVVRWRVNNLLSRVPRHLKVARHRSCSNCQPVTRSPGGAHSRISVRCSVQLAHLRGSGAIWTRNGQATLRQIVYSISLSALCARALCFVRNGPAKVPTNRCRYIETSGATKVHLSNDTVAQDAYICHSHAQHHIAGLIHPQKNLNLDFSVHFMVGTSAQTARGHVSKISSIFTL